jgi:hypothetical protein
MGPRYSRRDCAGSFVEVDENEAFPHSQARHQPVVALVEVEELPLLLHEGQLAVEVVAPGVVLAGELPAHTAGLLVRNVVPHQLVAAVAADVVERLDLPGCGAHQDDRGVDGRELFGEVAAFARKLFDPAHIEPGTFENRFALQLEDLRVDGILIGHRLGAQFGVVLRPAALRRLGESRHDRSCPFRSRTDPWAWGTAGIAGNS